MKHATVTSGNSIGPVSQLKTAVKTAPPSLRIGEAHDSFEQEADRIADDVMSSGSAKQNVSFSGMGGEPPLQRKCACGGSAGAEGECEECKAEKTLQRKAAGAVETAVAAVAPPIVHDVLRLPGQPLDAATRSFFEPRFGHDFSRVRVHADALAGDSAKAVNAHAYTAGNDIVFDSGRYAPTGAEGRKLLAHELAHTIQQRPVLSRQAKKDDDPLNQTLRPHDPTAGFKQPENKTLSFGACYGSDICHDLVTPSTLLKEAAANPKNKEKREHRKQVCKKPSDPACTADGHGAAALETEKLLHGYDSSLPRRDVKLLVDKDLESEFKALTMDCADFMPPVSGTKTCITIADETEKAAAQFNNTMDPTIDGEERGKWRERMVEILVHESEHARFRAAFRAHSLPAAAETPCATNDTLSAMNELAAMLTEFPIRMERIRTSVGLSPEDKQKELEEWREHRILGKKQSITVSLRTARCLCNCDDANKMIRETIEFTTGSWTQQQKNELHREMRDPRWSDLDLRWPFVAPPTPSVSRPGLQRKSDGGFEGGVAPAIVHDVLNSPGHPLDAATRSFFEPRYGHDFSHVRVHRDTRAAESAEAVDALAYTVGSDIVFAQGQHAPDSAAGRALLAHELSHVAQQQSRAFTTGPVLPISSPEDAAEREADAAVDKIAAGQPVFRTAISAAPAIRRKQAGKARVPNGEFTFEMQKKPHGLKEDVHITFSPDASGPSTKVIKFIQIVRLTDSQTGKTIPWGTINPAEAIKDKLGPQKDEGNVQAGFIVDVAANDLKPRDKRSDPSLSPEYPNLRASSVGGGPFGPRPGCVGCDLPLGKRDVTMDDTGPGGIPDRDVTFDFESAAYSEDLGIFYGSVRWHFRQVPGSQDSDSFPDERFDISPTVSDTLRASIVEFNKALKNKHRVMQGETLAGISSTYFGTASAAQAIFELNRDVVKDADPAAPLPPGIELELPTRWERARFSPSNQSATGGDSGNVWERAKVQRSATGDAPYEVPPIVHGVLSSPGEPLDKSTRTLFESRLGHDFSQVRVHTNSEAAASAQAVNALAYTVGNDLVFGHGQYNPATGGGQRLLAHELAHVVQQSRGGGTPAPVPDGDLERSAARAASDLATGSQAVQVNGASGQGIARVFAPSSLDRQLDPSSMSDDAIHREIDLITRWLKDNPKSAEGSRLFASLTRLQQELGHRPAPKGKAAEGDSKAMGGRGFAELRFPISGGKEQAPAPSPKLSTAEPSSINTPPPASKSSGLDSLLPSHQAPSDLGPLNRNLLGLDGAPAAKTPTTKIPSPSPAQPTPTSPTKADDDKPGLGLQTGTGEQTGLRAPHQAFQYVQISAEFSNAYVLSLKDDKLPTFLKGNLESISFLGEPGWTLQYHVAGDKPGSVDLQFLFKLVQLSLRRVDISLVGGEQFVDLGKKWESSRFTPMLGLESETKIAAAGPVSLTWVLDGLAALPQPDAPPTAVGHAQPHPGRVLDGQFSGELRLKLLWDIGAGK